jgi:hypothetical protein
MVAATLLALSSPVSVLFLGNSHTAFNDVPGLVNSLLRSSGIRATTGYRIGGHLDDLNTPEIRRIISGGQITHLVLQGQMISMSHKYNYSIENAVALTQIANSSNVKVILFAEWPRRGIAETSYIEGIYTKIAKRAPATLSPVGRAWDQAVQSGVRVPLWDGDGNHAAPAGSFVAAVALSRSIAGEDFAPSFVPTWLRKEDGLVLTRAAMSVFEPVRKKVQAP